VFTACQYIQQETKEESTAKRGLELTADERGMLQFAAQQARLCR